MVKFRYAARLPGVDFAVALGDFPDGRFSPRLLTSTKRGEEAQAEYEEGISDFGLSAAAGTSERC
jgi:hypothetical protein